jgi:hypothetical protein
MVSEAPGDVSKETLRKYVSALHAWDVWRCKYRDIILQLLKKEKGRGSAAVVERGMISLGEMTLYAQELTLAKLRHWKAALQRVWGVKLQAACITPQFMKALKPSTKIVKREQKSRDPTDYEQLKHWWRLAGGLKGDHTAGILMSKFLYCSCGRKQDLDTIKWSDLRPDGNDATPKIYTVKYIQQKTKVPKVAKIPAELYDDIARLREQYIDKKTTRGKKEGVPIGMKDQLFSGLNTQHHLRTLFDAM